VEFQGEIKVLLAKKYLLSFSKAFMSYDPEIVRKEFRKN
jgi:hypothetical protein